MEQKLKNIILISNINITLLGISTAIIFMKYNKQFWRKSWAIAGWSSSADENYASCYESVHCDSNLYPARVATFVSWRQASSDGTSTMFSLPLLSHCQRRGWSGYAVSSAGLFHRRRPSTFPQTSVMHSPSLTPHNDNQRAFLDQIYNAARNVCAAKWVFWKHYQWAQAVHGRGAAQYRRRQHHHHRRRRRK